MFFLKRRSHQGYVFCCPLPAAPWPMRLPDLEQDASNALLRLQVFSFRACRAVILLLAPTRPHAQCRGCGRRGTVARTAWNSSMFPWLARLLRRRRAAL